MHYILMIYPPNYSAFFFKCTSLGYIVTYLIRTTPSPWRSLIVKGILNGVAELENGKL